MKEYTIYFRGGGKCFSITYNYLPTQAEIDKDGNEMYNKLNE